MLPRNPVRRATGTVTGVGASFPRLPRLEDHARLRASRGVIVGVAAFPLISSLVAQAIVGVGWLAGIQTRRPPRTAGCPQ